MIGARAFLRRALAAALTGLMATAAMSDDDPFGWLEDVQGERALAWVRERNAETLAELQARPDFAPTRARLLELLNAKDRIPAVRRIGERLYNLWQDEAHPRGLWRRTSLAQYQRAEPAWETVLDLDALGVAEGENWVWAGVRCLGPGEGRCLVSLSRGGADASVVREFDLATRRFVDGGFTLPEAKSDVEWRDADHLYVGTDFGPGSLTDSGYPRVIKRWRRGTPLAEAVTVFEGRAQDVAVDIAVDPTPGGRTLLRRALDFHRHEHRLLQPDGRSVPLPVPDDAQVAFMRSVGTRGDTLLVELRSDWQVGGARHPAGALLATDMGAFLRGQRHFQVLFEPGPTRALAGFTTTRTHVLLNVLDNVSGRLEEWRRGGDGRFVRRVIAAPSPGSFSLAPLHDPLRRDDPWAEHYLLGYTDFLTPDTLWLGRTGSDRRTMLKQLPAAFDAEGLQAVQRFATSRDGTRVPYFVVGPREASGALARPTLLYGYGGFEISLNPRYMRPLGAAWLARGGRFVLANIRGGGEFGPRWHQAALREHRQRAFDDFIAVAEDLVASGQTTPVQLGIEGGSNGGLLVGAVMVQRPELFNAVVCQVPLLDMRRYHRLLAGASWMAEYGNPDDPADWAFLARYSPYQNLQPGVAYPRALIDTSTRDDRVHPGHARKMAARLRELGRPVLYYENNEGGHGGAADNTQRALLQALEYTYLWQQLGSAK